MNIDEYNLWIESIISIPISDNIKINESKYFLKFSPEKFSKLNNIDVIQFTKKCNQDKKIVHNMLLDSNNILKLKKYKPDLTQNSILCICINTFKSRGYESKFTFYKTIKYTYSIINNQYIIIDHRKRSVIVTNKEFNLYFIDHRDYILDSILR